MKTGIDPGISESVIRHLREKLPVVLYFDDFNDRVPDTIDVPPDYDPRTADARDKDREWRDIIFEIFNRAAGFSEGTNALAEFIRCTDSQDRENIKDAITQILDQEIIGEWKDLKKKHQNLIDDSEDLALELKPTFESPKGNAHFEFNVKETVNGQSRTFRVAQRSKGFQWFFNYTMKLKFNSQSQGKALKMPFSYWTNPGVIYTLAPNPSFFLNFVRCRERTRYYSALIHSTY
ncbi:MAG: hypothetical protein U5K33_10000 [Halofilum sp. (in: g-proteobacteria)]|nr:hypothetical protein [Halofilum sp. (in: g-proteobacteria)]